MTRRTKHRMPRLPAGIASLPQGDQLRAALRAYAEAETYWYIPKVRSLNVANIRYLAEVLRVIDADFSDRLWNHDAQDALLTKLTESGLLHPTATNATTSSRTALTRINKVLLETLGLLWVADNQTPLVTSAGRRLIFASEETPATVNEVIARQVSKLQYPNPTMPKRYSAGFAGILPHLSLLDVIDRVDGWVTFEEYDLFLNLARSQDDCEAIAGYIDAWRSIDDKHRQRLRRVFHQVPMQGQGQTNGVASSRSVRVSRTSPYQRSIFCFPHYIEQVSADKEIRLTDRAIGKEILEDSRAKTKPTLFDSREDWFAYYGDPGQEPSWFTYVAHQIATAADTSAVEAAVEAHETKLTRTERRAVRRLQVERAIENSYAAEPDLRETLEPSLQLEDRQVKTPIGQIDLLCRGSDGSYVVIEIKAGAAEDAVFGQILRYMGWIHRNYPDGADNVRGIILAGEFSDKAQYSRIGLMRTDAEEHLKFRRHAFAVQEV